MADYNRSTSYSYPDNRIDIYRGSFENHRSRSSRPDDDQNTQTYVSNSTYSNDNYFRSYSVSHTELPPPPAATAAAVQWKLKKGKSTNGSTLQNWSFNDPELKRRKRVASYKVYSVEGKVKGSFRNSFRWVKNKYTQVANGWW